MSEDQLTAHPSNPHRTAARTAQPVLVARPDLVVCDECDAVHRRIALQPGHVARCQRCNALLGRGHIMNVQGLLAFAFGTLLLIVIGNVAPIVTLDLRGVITSCTLPQAIARTWESGAPIVAALTAATVIVFPLCFTLLRLYVLIPLASGWLPRAFVPAMRVLYFVNRWSMVEVFMMGTMVAVVRSAGLASATPGIGLFGYAALTMLMTSIAAAGMHSLWKMGTERGAG